MRAGQRSSNQMRRIEIIPQFISSAEGSALIRLGETQVICTRGRQGGRTMEIQRLIGRSLRGVVDLEALGERTIWIDCDVIRADGGTRTASITGSLVALGLGLQKLVHLKLLGHVPLRDYVAAISVGIVSGDMLLDLDYAEDASAEVDMNVVMTGSGDLVEVQATAEGHPYSAEGLNALLDLARPGIKELLEVQKSILKIDLPRNPPKAKN